MNSPTLPTPSESSTVQDTEVNRNPDLSNESSNPTNPTNVVNSSAPAMMSRVPRKQQAATVGSPPSVLATQELNNSTSNSLPLNVAPESAAPTTTAQSTNLNASNVVSLPHSVLNLPPGVVLPPSVDPNLILSSQKAVQLLHTLTPKQMQDSLNEFDEAIRNKTGKVRNVTAYLIGVFKRYVNVNSKERKSGAPVMKEGLTPVIRVTLQKMIDSGFCTKADLTDKVEQKLKMLSEHDALLAIDELSSVQRETIRNFPSYFMGILNRYMRGMNANNNGGNNDQKGNKDRQKGRSRNDRHRRSSSRDSHDGDRRHYRSRRRRSHSDDYSRSPSPDRRRSRRDRSRSRSRDRYDDSHGNGGRDHRHSRRSYRSRSRSSSPGYRRGSHSDSKRRRDSREMPTNSQTIMYPNGMAMQQPVGGTFPNMGLPPPPPPPRNAALDPVGMQLQQQTIPQQQWQQHLQLASYSQPSAVSNMQGYGTANHFSSTLPATNAMYGTNNPASTIDILGLAEKAAQALSGLPGINIAQSSTGATTGVTMGTPMDPRAQYQTHQQLPQTVQQRDPRSNQSQQRYGHTTTSRVEASHSLSIDADEHANVTIHDLPPMIQYSLQNLQATGHLDKQVGQNACRWLKKLSEPVALQALERFSSCDVSQMRSKEGYLCGILKKAIDKKR